MSPTPIIAVSKALNHSPKNATLIEPQKLAETLEANLELTWYENIPDETPIKMYFDFDCKDVEKEDYEAKKEQVLVEATNVMEVVLGRPATEANTLWAESCGEKDGKMKVSYHAIIQDYKTTKATNKKVAEKMKPLCEYTDIQPYGSGNCGIQKMRLVGCVKSPDDKRKMSKMGDYDITKTFITVVDETVPDFKLTDDDWFVAKAEESLTKKDYEKVDGSTIKDLIPDLEALGFTNIQPIGDTYNFMCDQRNGTTQCPLCPHTHKNNQYRVRFDGYAYHVKNHSQKCTERIVKQVVEFNETEQQSIDDGQNPEYLAKKKVFEDEYGVAKIREPKPHYVSQMTGTDRFLSKVELIEDMDNFLMSYETKNGEPVPFTKLWFRDPDLKLYKRRDFIPYAHVEKSPKDVYNMFKGFRASKLSYDISLEERNTRIEPYLRVMKANCGGNDKAYDYLTNWFAQQVQFPLDRPKTAPVQKGEEGGGKSEGYLYFGNDILGEEYVKECDRPDRELFGTFQTAFANKMLVIVDECDLYKYSTELLTAITGKKSGHERKNENKVEVRSTHSMVFTSNKTNQIKLGKDGRRFFVLQNDESLNPILAEDKQGAEKFWTYWWDEWKLDDRNARAVYDYFMDVKIPEGYNWVNERPTDSEAYLEMRKSSLAPELKFIEHFITNAFPTHLKDEVSDEKELFMYQQSVTTQLLIPKLDYIRSSELYEMFKVYYPSYSKYDIDIVNFGLRLNKELKAEGVVGDDATSPFQKKKNKGVSVWRIDRQKAFEWLKRRMYTTLQTLPLSETDPTKHLTVCYRLNDNNKMDFEYPSVNAMKFKETLA